MEGPITLSSANLSTITVSQLTFSSLLGGDINTSTITVNKLKFSSMEGPITLSSVNLSTITVSQLTYSSLIGGNITNSTFTGSSMNVTTLSSVQIIASSIQGANLNVSSITTSLINGQPYTPGGGGGTGTIAAGIISMYAGSSDPSGWYICDGRSLSRTSFSTLFTAIGTTYGSVDGGSFSIPDLRNQFIVGVGSGYGLNVKGGTTSTTMSVDQLPAHSHAVSDPGHGHTIGPYKNSNSGTAAETEWGGGNDEGESTGYANNNTTGISISNTGGGNPIDTRPPYTALNYIIKY
jgi:microcystin-dependent protein